MARHTFATVIALSNGVPVEHIQKMLGHLNISTTQIYAEVLNKDLVKSLKGVSIEEKLEGD